jgi:hypothetical protein
MANKLVITDPLKGETAPELGSTEFNDALGMSKLDLKKRKLKIERGKQGCHRPVIGF